MFLMTVEHFGPLFFNETQNSCQVVWYPSVEIARQAFHGVNIAIESSFGISRVSNEFEKVFWNILG